MPSSSRDGPLAVPDRPGDEFRQIEGVRVRLRMHEKPGARKLLLTNALPLSIRTWDTLWDELSQEFALLAIDLPGFGLSESRADLLSPSRMAAFLAGAIRALSWDAPIVVGADIGAPVALALAQAQPELLAGIVVCDGPGFYPPHFAPDLALAMRSRVFRALAGALAVPNLYLWQVLWRARRKAPPSAEVLREYRLVNARRDHFANTMAFLSSYPRELAQIGERLGDIRVPCLALWGAEDRFVPPINGKRLAERIPGARFHAFPGCGHFCHEDAGRGFVEAIREWAPA